MPTSSRYAYTRVGDGEDEEGGSGSMSVYTSSGSSKNAPHFGITGTRLGGWVTVACTAAMVLFGYDQGVFGGIIITPDFLKTMGNPNATLQGAIVALYDIGCLFGALAAMVVGERLGRKKTFLLGVIVMSIGALMQVFAFTVTQMIVARIITGLGNGMNTATAPVWQSETCKPSWRGKLVVFEMVMNIAGFSISNWMTYGFSFITGSASWRFPIAFQLVFSFIMLFTIPWLPESPRWLLMHGHEAAGVEVLVALQGDGARANDDVILHQKAEIMDAVRMERDAAPSWSDILHMRSGETGMIQRLLLGAGAQLMQQLVGINVTSYYLPLVLQNSVGLSNTTARLLAAWNSVSYLLFAFAGIALIERAGRRKLLIWGATGQCICYVFISGFLARADDPVYGTRYGAGATVFFFLYYLFFGICWQGVPWLYPVEINSLSMRTKGAALATAMNWLSNYIIVEITPPGIEYLGWRFYLIWMFFNALFVPVVWLLYPETANRHLEDIDHLYRENPTMVLVFRNPEAIQMARPQRFIDAETERAQVALAARGGVLQIHGEQDQLRKRT
ncbi:hexose carrier protein [Favolaschia claudopus]|uniref:Hexose carrier protein n=1 Tax=Favolaschia claudopus TaxID=2862362 RepID=A0AAW0CK51_9AGAR